ncbi:hypothetical protein BKA62DRAFT_446682 [Auriculariales sp. MPI-PUGE-AT-0066]|nr:hypothetical protein BKA62DRAFT_446682 [Auriculariales sp. MPI-PUGE-AT-0066]
MQSSGSEHDSPPPGTEPTKLSVSTTFFEEARLMGAAKPDLVLLSADSVAFYVHLVRIRAMSTNSLCGFLPDQLPPPSTELGLSLPTVALPDNSSVLNIILHAVYTLDATRYNPSIEMLTVAVTSLIDVYGVPMQIVLAPSAPLYTALLVQVTLRPMQVYTLAAHYDLEDIATAASAYLLSYPLSAISDTDAEYMGGRYLKRLFFLHCGRVERLKTLLGRPPSPHPPTQLCDSSEQNKIARAWSLGTAFLVFNASPDTAATTIETSLQPLVAQIWCADCRAILHDRIGQLVLDWSSVRRTI